MVKRRNKNSNEEDYSKIKEYYNKALVALQSDEPSMGGKIVLNMPIRLYDMSLDILDNKNDEFSDPELRELIEKVDAMLCTFSKTGEPAEQEPVLEDHLDNYFLTSEDEIDDADEEIRI